MDYSKKISEGSGNRALFYYYENVSPVKNTIMVEIRQLSNDERTFGMLCHLSALAGFIFPLGNIIGPLIIWMIKKEEYPWVDQHGKESLNFQISMTIYLFISAIMILILIGIFFLIALGIINLVFIIMGSVKANNGEDFKYPLAIRFIN